MDWELIRRIIIGVFLLAAALLPTGWLDWMIYLKRTDSPKTIRRIRLLKSATILIFALIFLLNDTTRWSNGFFLALALFEFIDLSLHSLIRRCAEREKSKK